MLKPIQNAPTQPSEYRQQPKPIEKWISPILELFDTNPPYGLIIKINAYMYLIDVFDPNRKVVLVSDISRQKVLLPMLQVFLYLCSDLRLRMGCC